MADGQPRTARAARGEPQGRRARNSMRSARELQADEPEQHVQREKPQGRRARNGASLPFRVVRGERTGDPARMAP